MGIDNAPSRVVEGAWAEVGVGLKFCFFFELLRMAGTLGALNNFCHALDPKFVDDYASV
jgi:hypothetical protein